MYEQLVNALCCSIELKVYNTKWLFSLACSLLNLNVLLPTSSCCTEWYLVVF